VLVTDVGVFPDSTDILRFVDSRHRAQAPLYPEDDDLRREVEELEELFDTRLGPHSRRLAYFYLLPERRLIFETVFDGVSKKDRVLFRSTFPVIRLLMRKGMRITEDAAMRSLERVREVFDTVDERLADGRRYLVGESFSAADLCFAALAAPLLLPRGFRCRLPSLADLPAPLLPLVDEFRSSAAGGFALRLFRDER
jgi:glutathione S-transferase